MRRSLFAVLFASATLFAATETKPKDMCVPPPGGAAPSLPARILTGQGRIHFPITTSSGKAQEARKAVRSITKPAESTSSFAMLVCLSRL